VTPADVYFGRHYAVPSERAKIKRLTMQKRKQEYLACESCDLLLRLPELRGREKSECPRCGQVLERGRPDSLPRTLALATASLLLYAVAQSTIFMSFELDGLVQDARILTGIRALFADGKWPLASLILFSARSAFRRW
jgi:uncharacterized paraquat-inducible protein A